MKIEDDDFPYTSNDPSLTPPEPPAPATVSSSPQSNELKAALRLIIGSTLNGRDALSQQLSKIPTTQESVPVEVITVDPDETPGDQFKYLVLGLLFEIPDLFDRGLSGAGNTSSRVFDAVSKITSPITNSWIFSPIRHGYEHAAARGEQAVDRIMMRGRREELNSRRMVQRKALDDAINQVLEYFLTGTDIQELVEEQGIGVATGMLDEYREQSAEVDTLLERRVKNLFRKRAHSEPAASPKPEAEEK